MSLGTPALSTARDLPPEDMDFYCLGVECFRPDGQYYGTLRELADRQDQSGDVLDTLSNSPLVDVLVAQLSHEAVYGETDLCDTTACRRRLGREQYDVQVALYNAVYESLLLHGDSGILDDEDLLEALLRAHLNNL